MTRLCWRLWYRFIAPFKYLWVAWKFREWPPWGVVYLSFQRPTAEDITRTLELAKEHGWAEADSRQGD